MSYGIYGIEINGKYYIGKDSAIHVKSRIKKHLRSLENGNHYNGYLQRAFNKYGHANFFVIEEHGELTREELNILERKFIQKYDSYKNGYNLTLGGDGGAGVILSPEELKARSLRNMGEKNTNAKITDNECLDIIHLVMQGKSNKFIAELYDLHDRYVSLIRHKKRHVNLWEKYYPEYVPLKSNDTAQLLGGISEEEYKKIIGKMKEGYTNSEIEKEHALPSGTGSRIRNRNLFKVWWAKHFEKNEVSILTEMKENHEVRIKRILSENGKKQGGSKSADISKRRMRENNVRGQSIEIDGVRYFSYMHAEEILNIPRKLISARVKDSKFPNYIKVNKVDKVTKSKVFNDRRPKAVTVDGVEYKSSSEAGRTLGISRKTVIKRVEDIAYTNYRYKEGENEYKSNRAKKVIIDNIKYSTITEAARQKGISRSKVMERIKSEEYPNYCFLDN